MYCIISRKSKNLTKSCTLHLLINDEKKERRRISSAMKVQEIFNLHRIFSFVNHCIVSLIGKVTMKSRNLTKSLLIINDVKEKQQRLEIRLDLRSLAKKV